MPHATLPTVEDHSITVQCDRGGTFSDVYYTWNHGRDEGVIKLLSVDTANYPDAPAEGVRRVLEAVTGVPHPRGVKLPTNKLKYIRLSTTVATNALLERQGKAFAFVVTKGFKVSLHAGALCASLFIPTHPTISRDDSRPAR